MRRISSRFGSPDTTHFVGHTDGAEMHADLFHMRWPEATHESRHFRPDFASAESVGFGSHFNWPDSQSDTSSNRY
jgi:hypothetical protein